MSQPVELVQVGVAHDGDHRLSRHCRRMNDKLESQDAKVCESGTILLQKVDEVLHEIKTQLQNQTTLGASG